MTAEQAAARCNTLVAIQPPSSFQPAAFWEDLLDKVRRDVTRLTGSAVHDVAKWELAVEEESTVGEVVGYSDLGTCRVRLGFLVEQGDGLEVILVATKGDVAASYELFGQTGAEIGNSLHVARLLDLGVECALRNGAKYVCNKPFDERVRQIYQEMGFLHGETLDLTNPTSLAEMCEFVDRVYACRRPAMLAFHRPW